MYASVAAGVPVNQQPRLHSVAMACSAAAMVLQFSVAFGYWHVHTIPFFWLLLLSAPACTYLVRMPHGIPRPWGGAVLPFLAGLSAGVENVLSPVLGVVNLDGSNRNWGTRQLNVDLSEGTAESILAHRRNERIRLAALWFGVNCGSGALLIMSGRTPVVLRALLVLTVVHLLANLFLALAYSIWLRWCSRGYSGVLADGPGSSEGEPL